jgi:hypothetical protein
MKVYLIKKIKEIYNYDYNYDVFEPSDIEWDILPIVCLSKATAEEEVQKLLAIEAKNKNLSSKDLSLLKDNKMIIKYPYSEEYLMEKYKESNQWVDSLEDIFRIIELETLP